MSFDVLAPHYTWMEAVLAGPRLQRARVTWLEELRECRDILILGVGHGHFLRRCAQRFPAARITAVDASVGMLRRAEQRARRADANPGNLNFIHAALPGWRPAQESCDAIVTHFFLDCFAPDELEHVIESLARAARPAARWLLSDFAVPPRGLARQRARVVHGLMYGFFRRVTRLPARRLTEPDPLLAANGFELFGRRTSEWGLLRADCWTRGV
jgi:ubiquinone/menaquinone biosynthesis C-methylase UbiE